jgi:hypothetical protein
MPTAPYTTDTAKRRAVHVFIKYIANDFIWSEKSILDTLFQ